MRVYVPDRAAPEVEAYSMAKFSRSTKPLDENQAEISDEKAGVFWETFYFQYGHASIADLAHVRVALEDVSIFASMHILDEVLWDGQERSTRYQDFSNLQYVTPASLAVGESRDVKQFNESMRHSFESYTTVAQGLERLLLVAHPAPEDKDEARTHKRRLRSQSLDVARYLLPLGSHTSLGQITSARTLEKQIARLAVSDVPEAVEAASRLMDAVKSTLPTLVKHIAPTSYRANTRKTLNERLRSIITNVRPINKTPVVLVPSAETLESEVLASLLFTLGAHVQSYVHLLSACDSLSESRRSTELEALAAERGKYDELPREYRVGYPIQLEVLLDTGSFRDFHRHRRCVQLWKNPNPLAGWDDPMEVFTAGLGEETAQAARAAGLTRVWYESIDRAFGVWAGLQRRYGVDALYVVPLATRTRAVFKMDWAELAYIAEVRTRPTGHFAYRRLAWNMANLASTLAPTLGSLVRTVEPT